MIKNTSIKTLSRALPLEPAQLVRRMFVATVSTALLLCAVFWTQTLWAASANTTPHINENPAVQQEAVDFVKQLADRALTSLSHEDLTLADQEIHFRKILLDGFDVKYIGRISLGRHKKNASARNLEEYYALFPEYLVKVYTSRLTKLDTREVQVGKVLPKGKRDMYVRSKVINGDQKAYDVDWRVRPKKTDTGQDPVYKIIDVKIEGISMARTQRDDFTSRISESGIPGLISFMQTIIDGSVDIPDDNKDATEEKQAN